MCKKVAGLTTLNAWHCLKIVNVKFSLRWVKFSNYSKSMISKVKKEERNDL